MCVVGGRSVCWGGASVCVGGRGELWGGVMCECWERCGYGVVDLKTKKKQEAYI